MQAYLDAAIALVISPIGLIGFFGGLLAYVLGVNFKPVRWGLLSLAMFTASLHREVKLVDDPMAPPVAQVIAPIGLMQNYGRPLTVGLLALSVAVAASTGVPARTRVPGVLYALLAVQFVVVFKMLVSGMYDYAVFAAIVYLLNFAAFRGATGRWLRTDADADWAVRSIGLAAAAFVLTNLLQAAIDPTPLVHSGRFKGTTGNSQHAGVLLALSVPVLAYNCTNRSAARWERAVWLAVLVALSGLLVWAGSRAAALMVVTGLAIQYRRQLSRLAMFGVVLAVGMGLIASLFDTTIQPETLVRTDDTRSAVWQDMLDAFNSYPLFGSPQDPNSGRIGFGENSWLAMACACGLFGLTPLVVFGWLLWRQVVHLQRLPRAGRAGRADLLAACVGGLLIGSVFEAYLLAVINFPVLYLYVIVGVGDYLQTQPLARPGPGLPRAGRGAARPYGLHPR